MESKSFAQKLKNLVHLDIDAIHAYTEAIDRIDLQDVKNRLVEFRADHQRHVDDLSAIITRLGEQAPEFKRDFKGFLIEGMTTLRSVTGTAGALKAMKTNEELTNRTYDQATKAGFPSDIQMIIEKNRDDERRHLEYISQCIDSKVWEKEGGSKVA